MFFAIAQCFGALRLALVRAPHRQRARTATSLFVGYLVGAGAMIVGGLVAIFLGVDAEGKSLEDVATPLSVIAKPPETIFRAGVDTRGHRPGQGRGRARPAPGPRTTTPSFRRPDDGGPLT